MNNNQFLESSHKEPIKPSGSIYRSAIPLISLAVALQTNHVLANYTTKFRPEKSNPSPAQVTEQAEKENEEIGKYVDASFHEVFKTIILNHEQDPKGKSIELKKYIGMHLGIELMKKRIKIQTCSFTEEKNALRITLLVKSVRDVLVDSEYSTTIPTTTSRVIAPSQTPSTSANKIDSFVTPQEKAVIDVLVLNAENTHTERSSFLDKLGHDLKTQFPDRICKFEIDALSQKMTILFYELTGKPQGTISYSLHKSLR